MKSQSPSRLMLPSKEGFTFIEIDDIIRCEVKDKQTWFYIINESNPTCVPIPIKKYENILPDSFFKVHSLHLINLEHISRCFPQNQGYVLMSDGSRVEVAETIKNELITKLKTMVRI